jgi:hypothetical protein
MEEKELKQIREELYNKLQKEYERFIEYLKEQKPQIILERAYEKVFKEETKDMFYPEYDKFNEEDIRALNKIENPLDKLYDGWMDCDINLNELYEDNIQDTLDEIVLDQKEEKMNQFKKKKNDMER